MSISEFFSKINSRIVWVNLLAMALTTVALIFIAMVSIDIYTHHGEKITIPDVRKHSIENAQRVLEDLGMEVHVTDTGYVKSLPPGCVLEQTPAGGVVVKRGRVIYLTINALSTPTLKLPDIIDNSSYREAAARLRSLGFRVGEPEYILGEKDWVYGVKVRGRAVSTGDNISVDDELIIQVGNGQRDVNDSTYVVTDPEYDLSDDDATQSEIDEFEIVY